MLRIVVIGALSGLLTALAVIGIFRLLGMTASTPLIAAITGAVVASVVVGSISRNPAASDPDDAPQSRAEAKDAERDRG